MNLNFLHSTAFWPNAFLASFFSVIWGRLFYSFLRFICFGHALMLASIFGVIADLIPPYNAGSRGWLAGCCITCLIGAALAWWHHDGKKKVMAALESLKSLMRKVEMIRTMRDRTVPAPA